jgi:hypothetical protein
MTDFEIVLPRRVVHQPDPGIAPGGDCGACALGGLLGIAAAEAYRYGRKREGVELGTLTDWYAMKKAVIAAGVEGMFDRHVTAVPVWPSSFFELTMTFGPDVAVQEWWDYFVMALDAGYYGFAQVDFKRRGRDDGPGSDHWVLLVGARQISPAGPGLVRQEVLVSCSAKSSPDEEWVGMQDFLKWRGGYNLILARPAARGGPQ